MKKIVFIMMSMLLGVSSELRPSTPTQAHNSFLYAACSFMGLSIAQDCYAKHSIKEIADLVPAAITACFVGASITKPSKLRILGALFCLGVYTKVLSQDRSKNLLPDVKLNTEVVSELRSREIHTALNECQEFKDLDTTQVCETLHEVKKDFSDAAVCDRATIEVAELLKSYLKHALRVKPSVFNGLKIQGKEHLDVIQEDAEKKEKKPVFFKLYITQADPTADKEKIRHVNALLHDFFIKLRISDSAPLLHCVDTYLIRDASCLALCIEAAQYVKPNTGPSFVEELDEDL